MPQQAPAEPSLPTFSSAVEQNAGLTLRLPEYRAGYLSRYHPYRRFTRRYQRNTISLPNYEESEDAEAIGNMYRPLPPPQAVKTPVLPTEAPVTPGMQNEQQVNADERHRVITLLINFAILLQCRLGPAFLVTIILPGDAELDEEAAEEGEGTEQ